MHGTARELEAPKISKPPKGRDNLWRGHHRVKREFGGARGGYGHWRSGPRRVIVQYSGFRGLWAVETRPGTLGADGVGCRTLVSRPAVCAGDSGLVPPRSCAARVCTATASQLVFRADVFSPPAGSELGA